MEDTPGVTRDRLYASCDWNGRKFDVVDTGGIEPSTDDEILLFMREQAQLAIDAATVIVLVTEIGTGVTAADQEVANMLLRSRKPVVLCVNKMDRTGEPDPVSMNSMAWAWATPSPCPLSMATVRGIFWTPVWPTSPRQTPTEEDEDRTRWPSSASPCGQELSHQSDPGGEAGYRQ